MIGYKKIATNVETVAELKGILTNLSNKDKFFFAGVEGFSIAYNEEEGKAIIDEDRSIDEICDPDGLPFV